MSGDQGAIAAPMPPIAERAADQAELDDGLQQLRSYLDSEDVEGARRFVRELELRWPDSERVQHYTDVLAPPTVRMRGDIKIRSPKKEWEWLRQHAHEYPGFWLAVLGDQLVAADPDGLVVRSKARELPGVERPVIYYQPVARERG